MNKKQESNCACCQVVDFSKDGFKHLMRHAVFEREAKIDICKTNLILNFRPNEDEYPEFARINAMLVEADRVIVTQKQTKRLINELIETQGIAWRNVPSFNELDHAEQGQTRLAFRGKNDGRHVLRQSNVLSFADVAANVL